MAKPAKATSKSGVEITVEQVEKAGKKFIVFGIPVDSFDPEDFPASQSGDFRMVVATERWLSFGDGLAKKWEFKGGMHWGFTKPRNWNKK